MGFTLAIDFGSTNTKVVALDLEAEELLGTAQFTSTVGTNIMTGLKAALEKLQKATGIDPLKAGHILACSSAAGGLRMAVVGLVRELTTKVAMEAALGAGAKVVGSFSFGLSEEEVDNIERLAPDIVLLTGGTDGGNEENLLNNARALSACRLNSPILVAGNKKVALKAQSLLDSQGKYATIVPNVLPELDLINIEPAREAIRQIFMHRIVHAKGLDQAQALAGEVIMPTPMAVLQGARLIAEGAGEEPGLGDLVVADVGGATTNIHSISHNQPSRPGVIVKGLPEPFAKRTVEGDLGIRYNARVILQIAGENLIKEKLVFLTGIQSKINLEEFTEHLSRHVEHIPQNEEESMLDIALANTAVDIASRRHAGRIQEVYSPAGKGWLQKGKDLTRAKYIIGTGGVLAYGKDPLSVIKAAGYDAKSPDSLRPINPEYLIDKKYILFAIGLLSAAEPVKALRIAKKYLTQV
ncbi:MAG: glutamate mutase L [Dehalococcoidales bacterium]|nr:glutamate mutase L [Dehalococcoidales bacterium]